MGEGGGASMPSLAASLSPGLSCVHQPGISPSTIILGVMEASLHRHDWLSHWPLVVDSTSSPSLLPRGWDWDWKFQSSYHKIGSINNQAPSCSKSNLIKIIKDTFITRNSRGFRSFVPETGPKINYVFLIYLNTTVMSPLSFLILIFWVFFPLSSSS